jgi:SAM-dependent methyltransferase
MTERLDYYSPEGLSAAFYDVVAHLDPTLQGEVDYYANLIPNGSWVLELGCGTGRITLPLAERGYAVVGLDNAPNMLVRAEAKRAKYDPEVVARTAFIQGDMTAFALNHEFDAVIAPFFGHSPCSFAERSAQYVAISVGDNPRSSSSVNISGAKLCIPVSPAPQAKMSGSSLRSSGHGAWSVET